MMFRHTTLPRFALGTAAALGLAACTGSTAPGTGDVSILLTDAPLADVASATVWISHIYLVGGPGGRVTISDTPQSYDLLNLQGGVTAALGTSTIPVGDYAQLRMVVDSARLTLVPGITFADGSTSRTVKVPSGMQTGIKADFAGPVHVAPGRTTLVVDFDVSRNFVFTGTPASPTGVLFTPVLHASVADLSGSISGTSSPAAAKGHLFAILATSGGPDTVTTALADSLTGAYLLPYLPPGSYTVSDTAAGYTPGSQMVTVNPSQQVTGVNFTLTPK